MSKLKQTNVRGQLILDAIMIGSVTTIAVLLALLSVPLEEPNQASAQITPSASTPDLSTSPPSSVLPKSLPSSESGIGLTTQTVADLSQNKTTSNITQLATLPLAVSPSITPVTSAPISKDSDDADNSGSNNDDDDDNGDDGSSSSNDDHDDNGDDSSDDDDSGDDDGNGGGSNAVASAGGAFAFAG